MYYTNSTVFLKREKIFLLPQPLAPIIGRVLFGCWPLACSAGFISCTLFNNDLWPFLWVLQSFLIGTFLSLCCFGVLLPLREGNFFVLPPAWTLCSKRLSSVCSGYFEKLQVPSRLDQHSYSASTHFCTHFSTFSKFLLLPSIYN